MTSGGSRAGRRCRRGAAAAALAWSLVAGAARAGEYHSGTTLVCSECHVMHFSQGHGYSPSGTGGFGALGPGPNPALLRNRGNDLCLSCHDSSGLATDVLGASNTGSQPGIVRSGGHLNRIGQGTEGDGHTLDSLATAPGSQPAWSAPDENGVGVGLACTNCHAPHGGVGPGHPTGSQFRNLRTEPGHAFDRWVTHNDVLGTNDLSRDVFLRSGSYDEAALDWNEPNPSDSAIARWCGGCHAFVHGNDLSSAGGGLMPAGGTSTWFEEHPVWERNFGQEEVAQYGTKQNKVKVMSEIGMWDPAGFDVTPTCVTCHRAHGNGRPYGLIYRSGTGLPTEDGDTNGTSVDDLCLQCHEDGSSKS